MQQLLENTWALRRAFGAAHWNPPNPIKQEKISSISILGHLGTVLLKGFYLLQQVVFQKVNDLIYTV